MLNQAISTGHEISTSHPASDLPERVSDLLSKCELPEDAARELAGLIGTAQKALVTGDLDSASKTFDQVLLVVRKTMGSFVPLATAGQTFTMVLDDLQVGVKDPGQIYLDSLGFLRDYAAIEVKTGTTPRFPSSPDLEIVTVRTQAAVDAILACHLPDDIETDLIDQLQDGVRAFQQGDPLTASAQLASLQGTVFGLSGTTLTESQGNALLGAVVSINACLVEWVIWFAVAVIVIAGIVYLFPSGSKARNAFQDLTDDLDAANGTSTTKNGIESIVKASIKNLNKEQRKEIRDNLEKRRDTLKKGSRQRRVYDFAIGAIPK